MASTTAIAAAAAHSIPPFPMPKMPRVRPPPIPKGTPGPNTIPPQGPPRLNSVWADGAWRNPKSSSVKHRQQVVSIQMQKALQAKEHGMNIYAFKNMHNNQVIYSLSRKIDDKKLLKQFVYLGKKSVPSSIRPDMWRPYFSVHFPKTQAGAAQGLEVYKQIRELSLIHQLEAPKVVTHVLKTANVPVPGSEDNHKYKLGDGTYVKYGYEAVFSRKYSAEERKGRILNQASSSVAILSEVLNHHTNRKRTPVQRLIRQATLKERHQLSLSSRAAARLARIRVTEAHTQAKQEALASGGSVADVGYYAKPDSNAVNPADLENSDLKLLMRLWQQQITARSKTSPSLSPTAAYAHAVAVSEAGKQQIIFRVIEAKKREVDQQLDALPAEEKARTLKDMEVERLAVAEALDKDLKAATQALTLKYDKARAKLGTELTERQQRYLDRLTRKQRTDLKDLKRDIARRKAFVGPYAVILAQVDKMAKEYEVVVRQKTSALGRLKQNALAHEKAQPYGGREVSVYWADMSDGMRAKTWPESVAHYQLQNPNQHINPSTINVEQAEQDEEQEEQEEQSTQETESPRLVAVRQEFLAATARAEARAKKSAADREVAAKKRAVEARPHPKRVESQV